MDKNYVDNKDLIMRLRNNKVTLGHGEYGVDPLCELAADEIERLREVLRINTEQQAEHIKTLLESWEKERTILTDEIAKLRRQLADASWTAEMYRDQIDDRPKW